MPNRKTSQETIDAVNNYLAQHQEELTRRNRGVFEALFQDFRASSDRNVCFWLFKTMTTKYRREHDLKFVKTSQYYKPKATIALMRNREEII
jgi:hypothetical protein